MSLVGPRPPLEYEVAAYSDWHRRRLLVTPGMTGLWQVMGRSRVSFDEMVFEDVMYAYNQSLLTDAGICCAPSPWCSRRAARPERRREGTRDGA